MRVTSAQLTVEEVAPKDRQRVVETDEERDVLGDEAPADCDDADGTGRHRIAEQQHEAALRNARAARRRREVKQHVEEDHAPHDAVPVRIRDAEPQEQARHDGVDAEQVEPRLRKDEQHRLRRSREERDGALRVAVEGDDLATPLLLRMARDADDQVVEVAAPCAHDDGDDDNEGRQRDGHQRVVRDARHDARIVHEDERHAEHEEQDGQQRAHDDEHGRLAGRHARMAQEHQLCDRAARRARRQECEEVIAEDDLYGLVQRDLLVRYLDEMHEAAAVKEQPERHGKDSQRD